MINESVVVNEAFREAEKNLSMEERDAVVVKELEALGFIRNGRLAKGSEVPAHKEIELEFKNGIVKFISLPEKTTSLFLMSTKGMPEIFEEEPKIFRALYPDREVIEIKNPQVSQTYDISKHCKTTGAIGFSGAGRAVYTNTISSPMHYKEITLNA